MDSTPPARLGDAQRRPRFLSRSTITSARGLVLEIGVGSGLISPCMAPQFIGCRSRPFLRIAACGDEAGCASAGTALFGQSLSGAYSVRRRDIRCCRDNLDPMLNPESDRGARRVAAGSQAERATAFRRARSVAGNSDCESKTNVFRACVPGRLTGVALSPANLPPRSSANAASAPPCTWPLLLR
jgi:hypothetical protein